MKEELVGIVKHYFSKIEVAAIELSRSLKSGDKLHFKGATTDFEDTVISIQLEHETITSAKKGMEVGLKVKDRVREGDKVYLVAE